MMITIIEVVGMNLILLSRSLHFAHTQGHHYHTIQLDEYCKSEYHHFHIKI